MPFKDCYLTYAKYLNSAYLTSDFYISALCEKAKGEQYINPSVPFQN